jgi:hypothetical protein
MQVSMLRMNAGIGQAVERSSVLERQNSATRAAISELSSGDRIGAEAQRLGLVVPAGTPRFLDARGADAHRALTSMTAPGEGIVPSAASEAVDPAAATPALGQSGVAPATAAATATTDGSAVGPGTGQAAGTQPATTTQAQPDAATQPAATPTGQDPAASYRTAAPPPPTGTTGGLDASGQAG